ncbi:two pore calcium channel protein 1-like isoform X2 [Sitophilus oryzae]|uniref:Two pore calcium channel protein 1-like isoform X1 n=1 Tax=Sitophilus oryzae TaxID=7048 RepID=A0A6J2Y1R8_SITOR|nr:two pore calcium channel protein 1-like isoform X1 [Sitophilus oryzae]XP_030757237.1 two pore calcium channel protein 1-like isoform X2 [Sitophilus oryzae]
MAQTRGSPDDDGYKRFTEDVNNVSYGSANRNPIDEMGSRSSLSRDVDNNEVDHWEMNYHEAAIFLEEGENNEKFDSHPRHPSALPAYLLVHNQWYYGFDLFFSVVLLLLALVERPAVDQFELPPIVHSLLELVCLGVIGAELALKLRWIGWTTILKHKRTMVKCITLIIMVIEAIVVLIRQSSHFRVTRALRPIFLVDTRACGAVRRYIRQILQSLPPILDMLILLMFFVCSYALLGYFLFSGHGNPYFKTLSDSFVNMFVLLTTANFPDVMMPSYAKSKWSAVFFISYISTVLYVLMNLMLAVVYETFTGIEKHKFRKLLLHKRQACKLAFRLLVSRQSPEGIRFKQFQGLMRYYSPKTSQRDVLLIFRQLNVSNTGLLSQEEFLNIYDSVMLRWRLKDPPDPWFSAAWPPLRTLCRAARKAVSWEYFEYVIYALIVGNLMAMFIRIMEASDNLEQGARNFCASWDSWLFYTLFLLEAILRIISFGLNEYISSGWNTFDLSVTLLAIWGAVLLLMSPKFTVVVILRPLRILRLFKIKKRYRDIFGTLVLLSPLMWSTAIVMMVMYYFFAILGMELFSEFNLRNCCENSTVEDFYKYSSNSSTSGIGYYYLNNFSNLVISGVTLFELTVVNNWFIIMDAYATFAASYSRLFFMTFYLFTMVVLTIVVASVLEAFRFRIQYKKQTSKRDEELMLHEEVIVDWNSIERLISDPKLLESLQMDFAVGGVTCYIGRRARTRDVLQRHMYISEIRQWLDEAENEERQDINHIIEESQINARLINA